jgi:hypothetical protein
MSACVLDAMAVEFLQASQRSFCTDSSFPKIHPTTLA